MVKVEEKITEQKWAQASENQTICTIAISIRTKQSFKRK